MPQSAGQKRSSEEVEFKHQSVKQDPNSPPDQTLQGDAAASQGENSENGGGTMQKRRRVTRACDECRKKKIRCDGKQPCTHCTVYSYECSYDQPSNRRRNPAPVFLEAMEKKLNRAESLLQLCFPGISLDDPRFDALLRESDGSEGNMTNLLAKFNSMDATGLGGGPKAGPDSDLESMVTSKGALDRNDEGEYNYFGASSGFNFLRRMSQEFGDLVKAKKQGGVYISHAEPAVSPTRMSTVMMNIPGRGGGRERLDSPSEGDNSIDDLPDRDKALNMVQSALEDACAIIPVVHQPSFYAAFERIYNIQPEDYTNQDHRFLPLLYVVMALGCLFAKDQGSELERRGYLSATDEGYKYFWAARQLMDVTDCRDLVSLQAIIFMILFLQCSAKLATCYAFIGVALRSSMRMGMHRSFQDNFSPIEAELRKRCFWVIRKMDVFVGAMLGLPLTLHDHDIDQDFPAEVDDERITPDGIQQQPSDEVSLITATNHDFRLTAIVQKIIKNIYPIKCFQLSEQMTSKVYKVRLAVIKDIERDLKAWEDGLQPIFKPGNDAPPRLLRARNLLRMAFAHVQLLLYRPFLHYVSARAHPTKLEQSSQACAAACVHVSRNIIHITASMNQNGLLVGSYWFTMYTSFFAVLSLVFYALENEGVSQEVMRDAIVGRQTLAALAKRSMAADRCTATLTVLFDQITAKLKEGKDQQPIQPNTSARRSQTQPPLQNMGLHTANAMLADYSNKASTFPVPTVKSMTGPQNMALRSTDGQYTPGMTVSSPSAAGNPMQQHMQYQQNVNAPQTPSHQGIQMMPFTAPSQNGPTHPDAPQFSNMIFPSSDPFVYPNQPMLSLDQSGVLDDSMPGVSEAPDHFMSASTAPSHTPLADNFVDVNMMNVHQGQGGLSHQAPQQQQHGGAHQFMQEAGMHMTNDQNMAESAGVNFPGLDFSDFFGGGNWGQ